MLATITPQDFVAKWRRAALKERSASQEHFIDLCRMLRHPTPAEEDPSGEVFTFEAGATKTKGGQRAGREAGCLAEPAGRQRSRPQEADADQSI